MPSPFNNDQTLPTEDPFTLAIPANLVFDDDPLEALLGGHAPAPPTPASVVDMWRQGLDRSEASARALTAVLVRDQDAIAQIGDLDCAEKCLRQALEAKPDQSDASFAARLSALGRVLELKQAPAEAETAYRRALEILAQVPGSSHDLAWATGTRLMNLLEASDRKDEAARIRNRLRAQSLADKEDDRSHWDIRAVALNMFLAGQYDEAEAIYHRLVEKRYDLGSTHCHLARVYLMTDREPEARREAERAWDVRHASPAYARVRTLFTRTILQALAGEDLKSGLLALKRAMNEPTAHMEWTVQPVLDHLKERLGEEQHALLSAILAAISERNKLPELAGYPLWVAAGGESEPAPAAPPPPAPAGASDRQLTLPLDIPAVEPVSEDDDQFTFGTVVEVYANSITIKEYDFALDADVQRKYHVTPKTEYGNMENLRNLLVGDSVVLDYTEAHSQRLIQTLVKEEGGFSAEPGDDVATSTPEVPE